MRTRKMRRDPQTGKYVGEDRMPAGPDNAFEEFSPRQDAFGPPLDAIGLRDAECDHCDGSHPTDEHDAAVARGAERHRRAVQANRMSGVLRR